MIFVNGHWLAIAFVVVFMAACTGATENEPVYGAAPAGVSYADVEALSYAYPDMKISYGTDALQYGLLWLPDQFRSPADSERTSSSTPLLALVHGGCWLNAYDIEHTFALSTALAQAGYAVWSLEYRRTGDPGGGWPGTLEDVKAGLASVAALEHYPVDASRVAVLGHSAGGHLALLASEHSASVSAVVGLAAITDMVAYAAGDNSCQRAAVQFMGAELSENEALYQMANPAALADPAQHRRDTWLLHGTEDFIVPFSQTSLAGARVVAVDQGGHFDWVHPGTESFQVLLSTLKEIFSE